MFESNIAPDINISNQQLHYLEILLENIDDAFIATDEHFIITQWNKAAEHIYGITADEAIGMNRNELLHYEFLDSSLPEVMKEMQIYNKWKGTVRYIKKDGSVIYLQSSASVLRNKYDDITGYVAIIRDITQQYLSEQSLQNFTAILHFLNESFLIVDRNMRIVFLSPKKNVIAFHQSNYKIGDHALQFIPVAQQEEVLHHYRQAFAGTTISHEAESDGNPENKIYLHVSYMPVKNSFGVVTHVAIIINDLTEERRHAIAEQKRREVEEQLHQSRILFENFMENCPLPAWVTDASGIMQYMNPAYLNEFKLTKQEVGKNIKDLFAKIIADDFLRNNLQVLQSNKAISVIEQVKAADGNITTYCINKFPLQYQQQAMVAGWGIDVTGQVQIQKQLEEANTYKDKILAVVAHDLRSPLTLVGTIGQLIEENTGEWSKEELLEFFRDVNACNTKALTLLKELMQWGQNRLNKVLCKPEQVMVQEHINLCVAYFQELLDEKKLTVVCHSDEALTAYADVNMLKTIIRNFISNAIKFSPPASVITITASNTGNEVYISIADEGAGMSEEIKSCILRGTNNTSTYGTKGEKGIGIGLSICKDFIQANKGVMTINSNNPNGTIFTFSLPCFAVPE